MIGVVVATHGELAAGLRDATEMILGPQESLALVCLRPGDSIEEFFQSLREAALQFGPAGALILTDLMGASPYNGAAQVAGPPGTTAVRVVTGVSLPMVIEAVTARLGTDDVDQLSQAVQAAGMSGILDFHTELQRRAQASSEALRVKEDPHG